MKDMASHQIKGFPSVQASGHTHTQGIDLIIPPQDIIFDEPLLFGTRDMKEGQPLLTETTADITYSIAGLGRAERLQMSVDVSSEVTLLGIEPTRETPMGWFNNVAVFRVVLDSSLRIPTACKLLKTIKKSPVLVMTTNEAVDANREKAQKIENTGAQLVYVPKTENGCDLEAVLRELGARGIQQLLIEGGPKVIASFLKQELADAVKVYVAPKILGRTGTADINESTRLLNVPAELFHVEVKDFDGDVCVSGFLAEEPF